MEWPQKGAGRESLRFPLLSSVAQEAGHSPVGGDDDEEVPPCGAEFITRSRIRKRCDVCQTVVSAEKQKKANERLKARRAARRMCLLKAVN